MGHRKGFAQHGHARFEVTIAEHRMLGRAEFRLARAEVTLEKLFQPFQKDADSTGLGLYLSRAFMRSFRGDLRHSPDSSGCLFVLDLLRADTPEATTVPLGDHAADPTFAA